MTIFLHNKFINYYYYYYYYYTNYSFSYLLTFIMVGYLFQNYDTVFVRFYSCKKPHVYRVARILAFFPALWGFYFQVYDHFLTNAHIYAHKKIPYICVTNKHGYVRSQKVVVREAPNYTVSKKTPSCTMELKSNFSLSQG